MSKILKIVELFLENLKIFIANNFEYLKIILEIFLKK